MSEFGSKEEIRNLLGEFDRIGRTLPLWAMRLVNGLRHEWAGAQAELDGWKDGSEAVKHEYAALILRSNRKIEHLQIEARSADDEVVRLRAELLIKEAELQLPENQRILEIRRLEADLKNTSRDYSELRESFDRLRDERDSLKAELASADGAALNPELRTGLHNYRCMFCGKWYTTSEVRDHHEEHCDPKNWRPNTGLDGEGARGGNRRQEP